MKKFLVSVLIVSMLLSTCIVSAYGKEKNSEEKEIVMQVFENIEAKRELIHLIGLFNALEDKEGLFDLSEEVLDDLAKEQGESFEDLESVMVVISTFTNKVLNDDKALRAFEKAYISEELQHYFKQINDDTWDSFSKEVNGKIDLTNTSFNIARANTFVKLLDMSSFLKTVGMNLVIIEASEDLEEITLNKNKLKKFSKLAKRVLKDSNNESEEDIFIYYIVLRMYNFFDDAKIEDKKAIAEFLKRYGLISVEG